MGVLRGRQAALKGDIAAAIAMAASILDWGAAESSAEAADEPLGAAEPGLICDPPKAGIVVERRAATTNNRRRRS